ncbi:MAG: hypothetical protein EXQ93_00125 [Alphaproteobacteria bacterium]|nr:hypothetical protein [Alphaproteobacteria bacterium]
MLRACLFAAFAVIVLPRALPACAQEVARDRSVAVVFRAEDAATDAEAEHLWRAVAEDLAKHPELRVADGAAVAGLATNLTAPPAIAAALGVRFLLLGRIEAGDDIFKIVLELVDALSGSRLWSGNFFPEEDELDVVPDEIAGLVLDRLKGATL